jgi:hypothetical protein
MQIRSAQKSSSRIFTMPVAYRDCRFISLGEIGEHESYLDAELGDFLEHDKAAGDSFEFWSTEESGWPNSQYAF